MELSDETVYILKKLYNKKRIGYKHTEEKNCLRRLKNLPKEKRKLVMEEWECLIKTGWIIRLMKTGEFHVSLNPRFLREMMQVIENEKR